MRKVNLGEKRTHLAGAGLDTRLAIIVGCYEQIDVLLWFALGFDRAGVPRGSASARARHTRSRDWLSRARGSASSRLANAHGPRGIARGGAPGLGLGPASSSRAAPRGSVRAVGPHRRRGARAEGGDPGLARDPRAFAAMPNFYSLAQKRQRELAARCVIARLSTDPSLPLLGTRPRRERLARWTRAVRRDDAKFRVGAAPTAGRADPLAASRARTPPPRVRASLAHDPRTPDARAFPPRPRA